MNQLIKEKRLELGYTQSYMADYLGVSMQAVSRWEKGASYPDISLLPLLARLLHMDLNTLFNFKDSLTDREINHFLYKVLMPKMENAGNFEDVFKEGMDKIRQYPTCEPLARSVATLLEQFLAVYDLQNRPEFQSVIDEVFAQLVRSQDLDFRNETILMRVPVLLSQNHYEKAQSMIDLLPDTYVDKRIWQGEIYLLTDRYPEATAIYEKKLVDGVNDILLVLWGLCVSSFHERKRSQMDFYMKASEQMMGLFDIGDFHLYNFQLDMAVEQKDFERALDLLGKIYQSVPSLIESSNNPFRKLISKLNEETVGKETIDSNRLKIIEDSLVKAIRTDAKYEELRNHSDFEWVLSDIIGE